MAATARASLEAMRAAGYDMSVLFGITDFYWRFGYVRAWSESNYFLATANLPKEKPAGRLRRFSRPDRGDLADLYNRQYATTTGTAVHPFWRRRWRPRREGWLWTDARGRAAGYVQVSPKKQSLGCHEFVGEPEAILRVVGHLARRAGCDQVEFDCVPHDGPLARVLRRGTCRVETEHFRNEKALVRTINLASTLGKMAAELTRRLKRSPLAGWRGRLLIADPREQAVLQIGHGGIRIEPQGKCENLIRGGEQIAQLLLGTDEPAETIEAGGIRLRGEARRLADILFPAQHPVISGPDHF
jgi:hypothetical protein